MMDYLNFYSLPEKTYINKLKALSTKTLFKKKNVTYTILFIHENMIFTKNNNPFFFKTSEISNDLYQLSLSFIARLKNNYYIMCNLKESDLKKLSFLKKGIYQNIREIIFNLKQDYASLLAAGYSLWSWQNNNYYCSKCGTKTKIADNGGSIICTNIKCKKKIFPIVYPTVIINVVYENKILLARNKGWKKNLYSCLAGFCEQNESAEDAARREVYEEVGLDLKKVNYKYSQYWPFTNNLMLGFEAMVNPKKNLININRQEIEKANWFTAKEIKHLYKNKKLILPKKEAIAFSLIQDWLKKN